MPSAPNSEGSFDRLRDRVYGSHTGALLYVAPLVKFQARKKMAKSQSKMEKFVLEAIDPATECVVYDTSFRVGDIDRLRRIVDPDATPDDFEIGYELEPSEVEEICRTFSFEFHAVGLPVSLRPSRPVDELPYRIHTGRELWMMLAGTKPFAYFTDEYPPSSNFHLPEKLFEPHVVEGRFSKREYVLLPLAGPQTMARGTRVLLYSLKHEEWRIDAFALVQNTAVKTGWNESLERIVGSLLGYEEWQNDAYIEYLSKINSMSSGEGLHNLEKQ